MVSVLGLWLPLIIAAVLVFVASSLVHMLFKWHNADYLKLPNEEEVRAVLNKASPPPGQYVIPRCEMSEMQNPEVQKKYAEGPVGFVLLTEPGVPSMGPMLGKWFALNLLVAVVTALVASATLAKGAPAGTVFHVTALVSFIAYAGGSVSDGIWRAQPWVSVGKQVLDAVIYGAVSGGAFALLWPAS